MKNLTKKMILGATFTFAFTASSLGLGGTSNTDGGLLNNNNIFHPAIVSAYAPNTQSGLTDQYGTKYQISYPEEKKIGLALANEYLQSMKTAVYDRGVQNIQDIIIHYNPKEFYYADKSLDGRSLEKIRVVDDGEKEISAMTLGGGYIFITQELLNFVNVPRDDGYSDGTPRQNLMHNVYNNSMLSFVIAHEMSHWENKDFLKHYNTPESALAMRSYAGVSNQMSKEEAANYLMSYENRDDIKSFSVQVEDIADLDGIKYANNGGMYSGTGGALMYLNRMMKLEEIQNYYAPTEGVQAYNPHSTTWRRLGRIKEYLKESTGYRVAVLDDNKVMVDGFLLNGGGLAPAHVGEVTAQERSYYVAGQIGEAIRRGLFHKSFNIRAMNIGFLYLGSGVTITDQSALVLSDNNGNGIIIDKFFISEKRLQEFIDGKATSQNTEESYVKNLLSIIPQ